MTVVMPETTKSLGNKVLIVLNDPPADPAQPTLAELNAGLFVQCYLYSDFTTTPTQAIEDAPKKLCSRTVPRQLGTLTYEISDVQYSYVPQSMGTPGAPGNEAIEALTPGTEVYIYEGAGIDGMTGAVAATDVVTGYHLDCGMQRRGQTGDGTADEFSVTQSFVLSNGEEPMFDIVLA